MEGDIKRTSLQHHRLFIHSMQAQSKIKHQAKSISGVCRLSVQHFATKDPPSSIRPLLSLDIHRWILTANLLEGHFVRWSAPKGWPAKSQPVGIVDEESTGRRWTIRYGQKRNPRIE